MTKVIILRGVSGSGKSTFVKKNWPHAQVFSSDFFFMKDDKVYDFDAKKLPYAHGWCLRQFINALSAFNHKVAMLPGFDGKNEVFVVDNTNTTIAEIAPYYAVAQAYGLNAEIITLDVDPRKAAARNTHNVPATTVDRQYQNLVKNAEQFPPFWVHRVIKPGIDGFCHVYG